MRRLLGNVFASIAAGSLALGIAGCEPTPKPPAPAKSGHDHDHDHGHDHAHHEDQGPHEGHLVEIGDEEFHLEWLHDDDSGKVTIYVLDGKAKKDVPVALSELTIATKVGPNENVYKLQAVNPMGEPAKASQFELIDKTLIEALKAAGQGVIASTTLEIEGQKFDVTFRHEH